ncbi:MAG: GNAT family N-acetyltransferase [Bacteroidia bacterium]|nr:GNAT family N-acetyltransferase [Bacteroidia bacterium]MCZ2249138.1 GNAT family N-acetyltransferase [Bacteroidia bacterium]
MIELVPLSKQYLEVLTQWNYDKEVNKYFTQRPPLSIEQQNQWLDRILCDVSKRKYIIIHQLSKTPIGMVSLMQINKEPGKAEFGITIGEKSFWGTGVARMASGLLFHYAFQVLKLNEIFLQVFETNERGIRFFKKLGFVIDGESYTDSENNRLLKMKLTKKIFLKQPSLV